MDKFLELNTDGSFKEKAPVVVSIGSANAGQIPALNANGQLDSSITGSSSSNISSILAFAAAHG
jgi:hypothetical protein